MTWYQTSVDLVRAVIWPVVVLLVAWIFKTPLADKLAELTRAKTALGDLKFEGEKRVLTQALEDLVPSDPVELTDDVQVELIRGERVKAFETATTTASTIGYELGRNGKSIEGFAELLRSIEEHRPEKGHQ